MTTSRGKDLGARIDLSMLQAALLGEKREAATHGGTSRIRRQRLLRSERAPRPSGIATVAAIS